MSLVNPNLLDVLAQVESSNNPKAVNAATGARGLYQFLPIGWKDVQQNYPDLAQYEYERYAEDPVISRKYAEALLKLNEKRLGKNADLDSLLASYNYGIGHVLKNGTMDLPIETQKYIKKVYKLLNKR